jgi:uncharacterized protein (TIGR02118 family)
VIKLMSFIRRRSELTQEEFFTHWRDVHRPLIEQHAVTLGIRRYVQTPARHPEMSVAMNERYGAGDQRPYDGVAEIWIDSIEVIPTQPSEAQQAALNEIWADEPTFIDLANSYKFVGEEQQTSVNDL